MAYGIAGSVQHVHPRQVEGMLLGQTEAVGAYTIRSDETLGLARFQANKGIGQPLHDQSSNLIERRSPSCQGCTLRLGIVGEVDQPNVGPGMRDALLGSDPNERRFRQAMCHVLSRQVVHGDITTARS